MGKKKKSCSNNKKSSGPNSTRNKNGNTKGHHHNKSKSAKLDEDGKFRESLQADGRYSIQEIAADGNCLFRSLSDQLFHDHGNKHAEVRSAVCDFIEKNEDEFSVFLVLDKDEEDEDAADFEAYVRKMREDGEWGGNPELVAAARLYRRNIMVFSANLSALTINYGEEQSSGDDLLLSYHDNDHYSSVHDNNQTKTKSAKAQQDEGTDGENSRGAFKGHHNDNSKTEKKFPVNPVKKNDACPCGSGQKYKKCCWAKEKHANRVQKMGQSKARRDEDNAHLDLEDAFEMNGEFRVLRI